jgi:peptide/nickel transport system substrate-binding protein
MPGGGYEVNGYWTKRRLSRREALISTGAVAASAAFLAACGGSSDTGSGSGSGILARYDNTTSKATKGGKWQAYQGRDSDHFDPLIGTQATLAHTVHSYSTLLSFNEGTVFDPPDGAVVPDLAESYELSGDRTQVILKLRPGTKLDPRPPTSSRTVTVGDVKYSFDKWAALSPNRGNVLNSVSPDLPVEGITTPDASTIIVKLAHPDSSILSMLAWPWFLNVVPVEADGKFDPKAEMRGTGPWLLTRHEPSIGWSYERNPNWRRASDRPFLDGIEYALLPETAPSRVSSAPELSGATIRFQPSPCFRSRVRTRKHCFSARRRSWGTAGTGLWASRRSPTHL